MTDAFVSWSGGKDSCLACYRAIKSGIKVRYLLNMVTDDGARSRSHGLSAELLKAQAEGMGMPLVQRRTTDSDYETEFTNAVAGFKQEGVTTGVFGDIDFNAHREWIERVCSAAGIKPLLPLWLQDQTQIMNEFIDAGFKSVVVATRADILGEEWLGRTIDAAFLADLKKLGDKVTPCGEAGEYHSYVIDGPLFKKRVEIRDTTTEKRLDHWFLRIGSYSLRRK